MNTRATTTTLFGDRDGPDPMYNRLRNPAPDAPIQVTRGRAWSEELWTSTSEYLDDDLPDKATRAFHQCFWEMYIAAALLDLGLPLVPRAMRQRKNYGPDIQVGQNIWVEAIAVTAGTGPDAVPAYVSKRNVVSDTPDEELKLRLISGIHEKRAKFDAYIKKGLVAANDICIVALNGAVTSPLITNDWGQPRIVRAVMEFGPPVIVLRGEEAAIHRPPADRRTGAFIERTNAHQAAVIKKNQSPVGQGIFLDDSAKSVSACLYCNAHYGYESHVLGQDFELVHNRSASQPLRRGFINRGREYWAEGEELFAHNYGP